jgi:alpha-tubulin suppressor-like RCC1 family protein
MTDPRHRSRLAARVIILLCASTLFGVPRAEAAVTAGTVVSWGSNTYGQLGDGTVAPHHVPKPAAGLSSVVQVEGGREHGLARTASGDVYAWGWNRNGQIGIGSTANQVRSAALVMTGAVDIAAGHYSSYAVKADGSVWAWGKNALGQLGDDTTTNRRSPVQVTGLAGVIVVQVAGGRDHTMARTDGGTVYTWGSNAYGQLGDGTFTPRKTPAVVPGVGNVVDIMAGRDHSLAVTANGAVWAWGRNSLGQLGTGNLARHPSPVRVKTKVAGSTVVLSSIVDVAAGADHSMARTDGGTLYAWGANSWGQVGDGTTTTRWLAVQVGVPGAVSAIAGGRQSSIAVTVAGAVYTWGDGRDGQLGDGSTTSTGRTTPGVVPGLTADGVAMGRDFALAIVSSG